SQAVVLLSGTWPREAERVRRTGGSVWKIEEKDWRLRLMPRRPAMAHGPVQIVLADQSAVVVDGWHWLYAATYWLHQEASSDLSFSLPSGATVLGVAIDGAENAPLQPGSDRLWVPL